MINFDYNEQDSLLNLSGEISKLKENTSLWFFLESTWPLTEIDDFQISLFIEQNNLINSFEEIKSAIEEEAKVETGLDENASEAIKKLYIDQDEFIKKSKKAKSIYWGRVSAEELKSFTSHIKKSFVKDRILDRKQTLSAFHLAFSKSACNFSVPGAGKTTTVLAAFSYLKKLQEVDKIIVIGPLSCFFPWESEYELCFGKKPKSLRFDKNLSERSKNILLNTKGSEDLILMHYQSLANNVDKVVEFLKLNKKTMVVIDEAHWIKNPNEGVWAQAALKIAPHAASRVILTGTPAPNGFDDLINLFEFIWPKRNILPYGQNTLRELSEMNSVSKAQQRELKVTELTDSLKPYFIRVSKKDLKLPKPKFHNTKIIKMGSYQREIYDFIENEYAERAREFIKLKDPISKLIKAKTIRLRQTATNPALLNTALEYSDMDDLGPEIQEISDPEIFNLIRDYKALEIPEKFHAAKQLVESIIEKGEKVIVWANFVRNVKELSEFFSQNQIRNKIIYGDIPLRSLDDEFVQDNNTREKIIKDFHREDSSFRVLIANTATIGESISLHMACNNAIYLERDYNAASFLQSKDRIHRKGMPKDRIANYYFLESASSIDQSITQRLNMKIKNLEDIIEHPIPLFSISEGEDYEDIKSILDNYESRY